VRDELDFQILGPLAVLRDGSELHLRGQRQRLVLALLLVEVGRTVRADRLVERMWGAATPTTGTGPLRTYVWQLRRLLGTGAQGRRQAGDGVLRSRGGGYVLDVDADQLDSVRFERRFAAARATATSGRPGVALAQLDGALALWRGSAFGDLGLEPPLRSEATRLDQLGLEARELQAQLQLDLGESARVATELRALVDVHPQRERLWALLLTALYRSGRQADALRCYQEARIGLAETAGLEPGPELRELEQAILRQDPALDYRGSWWRWLGERGAADVSR
jgi:DNA-binding SARP family transcriptional activator